MLIGRSPGTKRSGLARPGATLPGTLLVLAALVVGSVYWARSRGAERMGAGALEPNGGRAADSDLVSARSVGSAQVEGGHRVQVDGRELPEVGALPVRTGAEANRESPGTFGSIEGVGLDREGYPEGGRLWSLRAVEGDTPERWVRTDAAGSFHVGGLRPGTWEVSYAQTHPAVLRPSLVLVDAVVVEGGRSTWVELRAPAGERSFYGEFSVRVEGDTVETAEGLRVQEAREQDVDLELISLVGPGGTTSLLPEGGRRRGTARVVGVPTGRRDPDGEGRSGGEEARAPLGEATGSATGNPGLRKGAVYFDGLEAGPYLVRIVPSGNARVRVTSDDGRVRMVELGLEREVDLTLGDLVLEPQVFSMREDFLLPALAQAGGQ